MNARRAARELAIISFSQLAKDIEKWQEKDIEEIIVRSARTLVDYAQGELKKSLNALFKIKNYIEKYEIEHPKNLQRPIESSVVSVPIPLTSDFLSKIDLMIDAADKTFFSMDISELSALSYKDEVKEHIIKIMRLFKENKKEIDSLIGECAMGWDIDRLVKIDRSILRIAIVELLYIEDVPISVSIDEAVELAKKYSNEESSSFINGILRQVVNKRGLLQTKE